MSLCPCLRDRGLRTFSWRLNERIYRMFGPEERQRAVDLYSATPMTTPGGRAPGLSDQAVSGALAGDGSRVCRPYGETHHPTGNQDQGQSSWCWAACSRSGPPNGSARASARSQLSQGVSRGRHGRVAAQKQERQPDQQACDRDEAEMPGPSVMTWRRCAAGSRSWSWRTR